MNVEKQPDLPEGFTLLAESNRLLPEKFLLLWAELACVCIHAGIISDINYRRVNTYQSQKQSNGFVSSMLFLVWFFPYPSIRSA
jgi:hypothetical protein